MTSGADARVDVQVAAGGVVPAPAEISEWAVLALESEPRPVCIRVVEEAEVQDLNARFRAQTKPTNVLSFPAESSDYLGDIAICAGVVAREAQAQSKTLGHHFAHMVVHGVLHLRGYDHETEADARRMEAKEVAMLSRLGIGNPYEQL